MNNSVDVTQYNDGRKIHKERIRTMGNMQQKIFKKIEEIYESSDCFITQKERIAFLKRIEKLRDDIKKRYGLKEAE